jgi:hypothetical protein
MFPSLTVYLWIGIVFGIIRIIVAVGEAIVGERIEQKPFSSGVSAIDIIIKVYVLMWTIHLLSTI